MNTNVNFQLENTLNTDKVGRLCQGLALLKTSDDILALLRDLLTPEEIQEFSRRLEAARLLSEGKTYRAVASETGMSTATVTRISRWLHHGTGGYRHVLQELSKP